VYRQPTPPAQHSQLYTTRTMMEEQHEVESAIPKDIVYNALEHSTGILQDVIQEEEERFYEIQGMVLVC